MLFLGWNSLIFINYQQALVYKKDNRYMIKKGEDRFPNFTS